MIKHIVVWTLKEGAEGRSKRENATLAKSKLETLRKLPGVLRLEAGIDTGIDAGPGDLVLEVEFENLEALDAYQKHPEHEAFKSWFAPLRDARMVVDYTI